MFFGGLTRPTSIICSRSRACIAAAAADKLSFTAVDKDKLRQRLFAHRASFITAKNGLVHRRKIVGPSTVLIMKRR